MNQVTTSYNGTPGSTNVRVQIRDAVTGSILQARTNSGIREDVAGSGFFVWTGLLNPSNAYSALWDEGGGSFAAPGSGEVIYSP